MNDIETTSDGRSWVRVLCGIGTQGDRRNGNVFTAWTFAWAVAFVASTWWLLGDNPPTGPAAWAVVLATTAIGGGTVWAYLRFVTEADELVRRIHVDALAIGFGGGLLLIFGYDLATAAGAPELEIGMAGVAMVAAWMFGQVFSTWRYR